MDDFVSDAREVSYRIESHGSNKGPGRKGHAISLVPVALPGKSGWHNLPTVFSLEHRQVLAWCFIHPVLLRGGSESPPCPGTH